MVEEEPMIPKRKRIAKIMEQTYTDMRREEEERRRRGGEGGAWNQPLPATNADALAWNYCTIL